MLTLTESLNPANSPNSSCKRKSVGSGFCSLLKRGIMGSFLKVSRKYLPLYVAEFEFRHNNRNNPDVFDGAIVDDVSGIDLKPNSHGRRGRSRPNSLDL